MRFTFREMTEPEAIEISEWHYDPPYDFYDFRNDLEDAKEFLDFTNWPKDKYFSVLDQDGNLVGFYEFTFEDGKVEIGLGLKPELTGKGVGSSFIQAGNEFLIERFHPKFITLKVASFNGRARKVYERAGFKVTGTAWIKNDYGNVEFIVMEKKL